jgi:ABC-type nitrate/sulfonate/bicarbonate transport system permease component
MAIAWRPDPLAIIGVIGLILLWYLGHAVIGKFMPPPHTVITAGIVNFFSSDYFIGLGLPPGGYLPHLVSTTTTVLLGVILGGAVGTVTGLLSARSKVIFQIFDPIVSILGTVPILVAAPFFLIWFGLAASTKVILVGFYTAVVLHIYAYRAIGHVNPTLIEYARTLGASPSRAFWQVSLPACVPELFGGLRTAFGSAWGLAAIAELLGALRGIGRVIIASWGVFDITIMMAGILWLGIIAMLLDAGIIALRNYVTRWSDSKGEV